MPRILQQQWQLADNLLMVQVVCKLDQLDPNRVIHTDVIDTAIAEFLDRVEAKLGTQQKEGNP